MIFSNCDHAIRLVTTSLDCAFSEAHQNPPQTNENVPTIKIGNMHSYRYKQSTPDAKHFQLS